MLSFFVDFYMLINHLLKKNRITPYDHVMITPAIIRQCDVIPRSGKGDGDIGFRSDYLMAQRLLFCRYCLIQCWCMVIYQTQY